jgi:hydrogenase-4 component E
MLSPGALIWLSNLNALACGLFLLAVFGLVATRQVQGCVRLFVATSLLLAASAFLLSAVNRQLDLVVVGAVDIVVKAFLVPRVLKRTLHDAVFARREVTQVLNVPTALLLALALAVTAYLVASPLVAAGDGGTAVGVNLPIGLAGVLIGGLTATLRREALPLFLGLLAMENGAFLAGIGIAPEMPLIAEVAIAFDVLILVFVVGVLTRAVQRRIGTTEVGVLTALREDVR